MSRPCGGKRKKASETSGSPSVRIGIDISQAVSPRDGIGNYASHLTRALMATPSPHEFTLHALSRPLGADEVRRQFPRMPPNFQLRLDSTEVGPALDVFHSPSWVYPRGVIGRVVTTCHDLTFLSHPQFHLPSNNARCTKGMLEALLNDAHFLCVSQHTRGELGRRLGVPEQQTSVIYEGACDVFQPRDRRRAARRWASVLRSQCAPPRCLRRVRRGHEDPCARSRSP